MLLDVGIVTAGVFGHPEEAPKGNPGQPMRHF